MAALVSCASVNPSLTTLTVQLHYGAAAPKHQTPRPNKTPKKFHPLQLTFALNAEEKPRGSHLYKAMQGRFDTQMGAGELPAPKPATFT